MGIAKHSEGYSCFLYRVLVTEGRHGGVPAVARKLGVPRWTLNDYCNGRRTVPADLPARLFRATCDRDFLAPLVAEAGFLLVEAPRCPSKPDEADLLLVCIDVQLEVTDVLVAVREALEDGEVDGVELRRIGQKGWEAMTALAGLSMRAAAAHKRAQRRAGARRRRVTA